MAEPIVADSSHVTFAYTHCESCSKTGDEIRQRGFSLHPIFEATLLDLHDFVLLADQMITADGGEV